MSNYIKQIEILLKKLEEIKELYKEFLDALEQERKFLVENNNKDVNFQFQQP